MVLATKKRHSNRSTLNSCMSLSKWKFYYTSLLCEQWMSVEWHRQGSILVRCSHACWNYKSKAFLLSSVSQLTHTPVFSSSSRYVSFSGHKRLTAMCLVIWKCIIIQLLEGVVDYISCDGPEFIYYLYKTGKKLGTVVLLFRCLSNWWQSWKIFTYAKTHGRYAQNFYRCVED